MRDNTDAALALASRGLRVFPLHSPRGDVCDCNRRDCPSPSKHPRTRNGLKDATADETEIRRWWGMWPMANIGVVTGKDSGVVVLDVDIRHEGDKTLNALCTEHEWMPPGPLAQTGGGGWHFWFAHPGMHVPSRNGIVGAGLDVKGDGGYVVAPPSVHQTGVSYEWQDALDVPLPAIPPWLLELMLQRQEERDYSASDTGERPKVGSGMRNSFLASRGGALSRRGFSQKAIFAALMEENAEVCEPPLERNEVAQVAASVARYAQQEATLIINLPQKRGERPKIEPRTVSMRDIQTRLYPPKKMAVPDLMPIGLALLAGRLKLGKSWLMLGVAIAISEGGIALNRYPVEDGDVLYIAYEDNEERVQRRGKVLLGETRIWPERMHVSPSGGWPGRDEGGLDAIDSWLGQHPSARLVVLDTLQRFRGGGAGDTDRNAYAADYNVSAELQELAMKHECVIVAVHHYRKSLSDVDWVDQISGTNGIAGAADTLMGFERARGEQDAVLKVTGRDIDENEFALAFSDQHLGWGIVGTAEDARLSKEAKAATEALLELGRGEPVHYKRVAEHLGQKHNTAYQMLKRLGLRGDVTAVGGGFYGVGVNVSKQAGSGYENPLTPHVSPLSTDINGVNDADAATAPLTSVDNPLTPPLSTDSESKTGHFDTLTPNRPRHSTPGFTASAANGSEPQGPCAVCGKRTWVVRAAGGHICGTCKPWEQPSVKEDA